MEKNERTKYRKSIVDLLKVKKLYEKTDLNLIDELLYQYDLMTIAKADILLRGIQVNVRNEGEPLMQINQSVGIVHKCTRTIQSIYRQLAIAPQDRIKLKDKNNDGSMTVNDLNEFLDAK